jgi:hypothetical protein
LKQLNLNIPLNLHISQNWQLFLFGIAHTIIFLVIFQMGVYGNYFQDDFSIDYSYASRVIHGQLPYRDFNFEYPPLSILFIVLPRIFVFSHTAYIWAYAVEILFISILGMFVIASLARYFRLNIWKTLGIYTICLLAIGPLITVRFDLIPAVITLLAIHMLIKGHFKIAWVLLAIGVFTKLYPAILAPMFLIYQIHHNQKRAAIIGIMCFIATSIIIVIPPLILSPAGLWQSLTYHAQRGLQIESTYASVLELLYGFKLVTLDFTFSFGSVNVVSPLADILAKVSFGVMVIALVTVYWLFYRRLKNCSDSLLRSSEDSSEANSNLQPNSSLRAPVLPKQSLPNEERHRGISNAGPSMASAFTLVNFSIVAILTFMLTSKTLSPQYIIWIFPFVPLITGKWRNVCWLLFVMVGLMTFFVYPKYYGGIEHGELITVGILFLRNLVLIMLVVLATRYFRVEGEKQPSTLSI